jgi:hypothetical protein
VLLILTGALAMSDTAPGDDKKEEPKKEEKKRDPDKKDSYDLKVTVRQNAGAGGFVNPLDTVAYRMDVMEKGAVVPVLSVWTAGTTIKTPKGSEITTADGVTWIVTRDFPSDTHHLCYVTKKEPAKKPE